MSAVDRGGEPQPIARVLQIAEERARRFREDPPAWVAEQEAERDALAADLDARPQPAPRPPSVPVRYRTPLADLEQTTAVRTATAWLERWEAGERGHGLLLVGPVGAGKSAIAGALAVAAGAPTFAQFWPVPDLIAALQDEFDGDRSKIRHRIAQRDLLVLDDLGAERPTDWTTGVLSALVAARYDAAQTLIVTANLTAPQLGEHLGERALSRLHEMTDLVVVDGDDRRRR